MLNIDGVSKSVFNNGNRRELPGQRDMIKDRFQCTKNSLGLLDGRIDENQCKGMNVGGHKLDWKGDNLNLVEPTQMNSEKRLETENVLFCR